MSKIQEEARELYENILRLRDKGILDVTISNRREGRLLKHKYEIHHIETIDITPKAANYNFEDIIEALILLRVDMVFVKTLKRRYKRHFKFGVNKAMNTIKVALGDEVHDKVKEFLKY